MSSLGSDLLVVEARPQGLKARPQGLTSRPGGLPANQPLTGQLTLELPTQRIPTDPAELASYNSKLATICQAALRSVDAAGTELVKIDVLDEAGTNLCPGNP